MTKDNEFNIRIAKKMIKDTTLLFDRAIEEGNWSRVAELEAYISGMEQILIVFDKNYFGEE